MTEDADIIVAAYGAVARMQNLLFIVQESLE